MALNRFLSTETGSVKVEVTNATLKTTADVTGDVSVVGTVSVDAEHDLNKGAAAADTLRVAIVNDQDVIAVDPGHDLDEGDWTNNTLQTVVASDNPPIPTNLAELVGNNMSLEASVIGSGTQRMTLANDDFNAAAINLAIANCLRFQDPWGLGMRGLTDLSTAYTVPMRGVVYGITLTDTSFAFNHPSVLQYWRQVNNSTVHVVSSDVNDTALGTGARTVWARGTDNQGVRVFNSVELNGQTSVSLFSGITVDELVVQTVGSNLSNVGTLSVIRTAGAHSGGVPTTANQVFKSIAPGRSMADVSYWSIESGKKLWPVSLSVTTTLPITVHVEYSYVTPGEGGVGAVNTQMFEAAVNDSSVHDLRHLPPFEQTGIQVHCGRIGAVNADASYTMFCVTDEDLSLSVAVPV